MSAVDIQKKGNLFLVQDDTPRPVRGARRLWKRPRILSRAELVLDRRMKTRFAAVEPVPSKSFYHIREGVGFPWRVLARHFVTAYRAGVSKQQVQAILREFQDWTDDLYNGQLERDGLGRAA